MGKKLIVYFIFGIVQSILLFLAFLTNCYFPDLFDDIYCFLTVIIFGIISIIFLTQLQKKNRSIRSIVLYPLYMWLNSNISLYMFFIIWTDNVDEFELVGVSVGLFINALCIFYAIVTFISVIIGVIINLTRFKNQRKDSY